MARFVYIVSNHVIVISTNQGWGHYVPHHGKKFKKMTNGEHQLLCRKKQVLNISVIVIKLSIFYDTKYPFLHTPV